MKKLKQAGFQALQASTSVFKFSEHETAAFRTEAAALQLQES